jgi:hypothetical protein
MFLTSWSLCIDPMWHLRPICNGNLCSGPHLLRDRHASTEQGRIGHAEATAFCTTQHRLSSIERVVGWW